MVDKTAPLSSGVDKTAPLGTNTGSGKTTPESTQASMSGHSKARTASALKGAKKNTDKRFSKEKKGGTTAEKCPPSSKNKWLKVKWNRDNAFCGDSTELLGTSHNITADAAATGQVEVKGSGTVGNLNGKAASSFNLAWKVAEVVFSGANLPEKKAAVGTLKADGLTAKTPKALAVKRVPDKAPAAVGFQCRSPKSTNGERDFSWKAAFKLGLKDDTLLVRQTLQVKKAWHGRHTSFDAKADKLKQTWGYVRQVSGTWKYYNYSAKAWKNLPRPIGKYSLNDIYFVKKGTKFVSRDDGGTSTWPESFSEPAAAEYEKRKTDWNKRIHHVWNNKLNLHRKDCKSKATGCCQWKIDVEVTFSENAGDLVVYFVAGSGRSNSKSWFMKGSKLGHVAAHENGHLLGAYDEYKGGAIHPKTKKITNNSIMGNNLTVAYPRHLEGLRAEAKKKINAWTGRKWKFEIKKA